MKIAKKIDIKSGKEQNPSADVSQTAIEKKRKMHNLSMQRYRDKLRKKKMVAKVVVILNAIIADKINAAEAEKRRAEGVVEVKPEVASVESKFKYSTKERRRIINAVRQRKLAQKQAIEDYLVGKDYE